MARRFSLFRRTEPGETSPPAPAGDEAEAGFGFVTMGTDDAPAASDPDQPVILGRLYNGTAEGGNDVAVESLTIAHEGVQLEDTTEIFGFSHEVKSPPDAAATGETLQIHGQYDMDTTVEADQRPFEVADAAADGPSTLVNLFRGEVTSIEPAFEDSSLPGDPGHTPDDLDLFD